MAGRRRAPGCSPPPDSPSRRGRHHPRPGIYNAVLRSDRFGTGHRLGIQNAPAGGPLQITDHPMNRQRRFEPRSSDSNPGPPTIGRAANIEVSRRSYVERRPSVRAANPGLAAVGSEKSCVGVMPQADWRRGRVKTFLCAYFIKLLFWANEPLPHREVGRKKV